MNFNSFLVCFTAYANLYVMNIGSTRMQEIESMRESMDRTLWIWAGFHYRDEGGSRYVP